MKSTFLDLKTMGENPTIDDLPISPLFGIVSAPCIAPSRIQDEKNYFTLSRKYHNPFTSTFATMDIPCFYDPNNGRHSSVANATNGKAVFSVAGEVFLGRKLVQIIANEIEWSYPAVEKTNGDQRKTPRKALKSSHLDFEEKFINSNSNKRRATDYVDRKSNKRRGDINHDVQEESSTSRLTKLGNAISAVIGNNNNNNKGKERASDLERDLRNIENVNNKETNYDSYDTEF